MIMAALCQHITYNEFLPMVLGKEVMERENLVLGKVRSRPREERERERGVSE